jgi:copper chaperone CopZ
MEIRIQGMTCQHCVHHVTDAILEVTGVTSVRVDLESATAHVEGRPDLARIAESVRRAGYAVVPT